MKIGILTFHNALNYGAVLQAYALQEVFARHGNEVEVIDYRNEGVESLRRVWSLKYHSLFKILYRLLFLFIPLRRKEKGFKRFMDKCLHVSSKQYDVARLPQGYDMYVIGSDQVWNPMLTDGVDPIYWGKGLKGKVITYAASSGSIDKFTPEHIEQIRHLLPNLSAISVRETRLKTFLEHTFSTPSQVVLDPTLLAGSSCFETICAPRLLQGKYVLAYSVEQSPSLMKVAREVAKRRNAELVCIGLNRPFRKKKGCRVIMPDVYEFLSLIKYADCVVSLSFHGTAFSLLFEKDFYTIEGGNMDRVKEVVLPLGLENRILSSETNISDTPIDYEEVKIRLQDIRSLSLQFIEKNR